MESSASSVSSKDSNRSLQQCGAVKQLYLFNKYLLLVTFETDDNYSIRLEMKKKHYSHSTSRICGRYTNRNLKSSLSVVQRSINTCRQFACAVQPCLISRITGLVRPSGYPSVPHGILARTRNQNERKLSPRTCGSVV